MSGSFVAAQGHHMAHRFSQGWHRRRGPLARGSHRLALRESVDSAGAARRARAETRRRRRCRPGRRPTTDTARWRLSWQQPRVGCSTPRQWNRRSEVYGASSSAWPGAANPATRARIAVADVLVFQQLTPQRFLALSQRSCRPGLRGVQAPCCTAVLLVLSVDEPVGVADAGGGQRDDDAPAQLGVHPKTRQPQLLGSSMSSKADNTWVWRCHSTQERCRSLARSAPSALT